MLLKNICSINTLVVFTDICVFCFFLLVSFDPQKCSLVWYMLKHWVAHNPTLHSQPLNFVLVSLLLLEHTWHRILLPCLNQCLLCTVSSLFSWLLDGACFPCLVVKMLSEVFIGVGRLCLFLSTRTSNKPVDYRYSRSTVCVVSQLCAYCASNIICVIASSINLLLGRNVLLLRWMCFGVWF